jgi:hypothetical protein
MEALRIDQLPKLEPDHVLALQAWVRGTATPAQQVTSAWVIQSIFCGLAAMPPAKLSEREAGFMSGKQWVALAINRFADVPLFRASEQPVHPSDVTETTA